MRRFALILGWLLAAIVVAVATLPWWLGAAVAGFGPSIGLTVGEYKRDGYANFIVRQVEYRRAGVRVTAEEARSETPLLWWWHRVTGQPGLIVAGKWTTDVQPTNAPTKSNSGGGWVPLRATLGRVFDIVDRWVPKAEIGPGVVTWKGGRLEIGPATWINRTLVTPSVKYRAFVAAVKIEGPRGKEIQATLNVPDGSGNAVLRTEGAKVLGTAAWWGQRVDLMSAFPAEGWMPTEASLHSQDFAISGERAKLAPYYATLRGNAAIDWRNGDLTANVAMEGVPAPNTKAPPLSLKLRGHGADGLFVADQLDANLPGVTAHLSEPVSIDRTGKLRSSASKFVLSCNLAEQPWFAAQGLVHGAGTISAGNEGIAKIVFTVQARDVHVSEFAFAGVDARGAFEWPRLEIANGTIRLLDGNDVALNGGWNFKTREISDASIRGKFGRAVIARWLPEKLAFDTVAIDARASGPLQSFAHEGRVEIGRVEFEKINPVSAVVDWHGHGVQVEQFTSRATAASTALLAEGAVDAEGVNLTRLQYSNGDATRLTLARPARVRWKPQLTIEQLRLEGPKTLLELDLNFGASGKLAASIRNLQSEWFRDVVKLPATKWAVDELDAQAHWDNGPATLTLNTLGTVHLAPERAAQLSARIAGGANGLRLESVRIAEGTGEIVNATGQLPVIITPATKPLIHMDDTAPFRLTAASLPNPGFWDKLSELAGIEIVSPEMRVDLSGTWMAPSGSAEFRAARIAARPDRFKFAWPKVETLDVRLTGDRGGVKLENFSVAVDGQLLRAQGALPVSADKWGELMRDPRGFARTGDLHVEVPDADIAAIAHHFPAYLAPKGRLKLDLTFRSDETITGFLRVSDATSRPLGPLGVLQEVNANVVFEGRAANLEGVTARMGGQAVTLQGRAELPRRQPARLDLTLKGENLPFVRQTGLLLRGDLDLKLSGAGTAATISGQVKLRDSLFLSDVRALIPSGAKGGPRRPPYFAIEAPPLNSWRLNVTVNGDRFLRLRTPVFNGTASASFRLSGSLGDPRIEGEAVIDEGNVRLPFANFAVQQGQVRLAPEQLEPQIWITGTTRRYGYDVRMELTGSTSSPNLTFTSSPPLEAEQVLLMVMAGQAPQNEITTTDRQRVARFGAFFGQSLLGSIGGDTTGADRLTITSGENVSEQGRETYNIEYRLDNRWSLTGEYDEFDDYYGGLKWRFYERGGRKPNESK